MSDFCGKPSKSRGTVILVLFSSEVCVDFLHSIVIIGLTCVAMDTLRMPSVHAATLGQTLYSSGPFTSFVSCTRRKQNEFDGFSARSGKEEGGKRGEETGEIGEIRQEKGGQVIRSQRIKGTQAKKHVRDNSESRFSQRRMKRSRLRRNKRRSSNTSQLILQERKKVIRRLI